jgi:hypothetical protein
MWEGGGGGGGSFTSTRKSLFFVLGFRVGPQIDR